MISGRQALAQLEQAIASTREDEYRLDAALASATETAERLRAEQTEAYRQLARVRLDAHEGEALDKRLDRAEREALALLAEKRKSLAELAQRRAAAAKRLGEAEGKRNSVASQLEEILGRMNALRGKTEKRIANQADWTAANDRVKEAEAMVARAEAKAKQAEEDRVEKGAPFENDRLFMYLWNNGFGTHEYRAGPFVRYFDRKVAKLCAFIDNRPNYAMLTEIPVRLRAHVERQREQVAARVAERAKIERVALVADGIEALEAEFTAVKGVIDAGNAGIASTQNDLATLDASHDALVSGNDPALTRALEQVAASLEGTDLKTLYADAFATPTPEDEKIVRRIEGLLNGIARAEHELQTTRDAIRETARRRNELETTRDQFQRNGYDRPGVGFNNENLIGQMIGGIIGGIISSPELWRVILGGRQTYHNPSSGDWFGGGPQVPGGGGWSGGGSSDGGSSGGFGGDGGFSTGGGFGGDGGSSTDGGF